MHAIASIPAVRRLFLTSLLARLPLTMLSVALLVHVHHLTGSFAAAGAVDGAYAVATALSAPFLGRLADRRGQTALLLVTGPLGGALLVAIGVMPVGAPLVTLVVLGAAIGIASPPVAACVRALLPGLLPDPAAARAAYAVEASAVELTWISGPPLALAVGAAWSTGAPLVIGGLVLGAATVALALAPASRAWRPVPGVTRPAGGALRAPGLRTLVIAFAALGVVYGAAEIGVTAAATALGSTAAAGPLLGVWGVGSLVGGLAATRCGGGARSAAGLSLLLAGLTLGHLALVPAAGSVLGMAGALLVGGAAIAPSHASIYAMVDEVAPGGTTTEAFSWLNTAAAIGAAIGAAAGGPLAGSSPQLAFLFAGAAGALAVLITLLRAHTLGTRRAALVPAAA